VLDGGGGSFGGGGNTIIGGLVLSTGTGESVPLALVEGTRDRVGLVLMLSSVAIDDMADSIDCLLSV
jgi:hypothetical protein